MMLILLLILITLLVILIEGFPKNFMYCFLPFATSFSTCSLVALKLILFVIRLRLPFYHLRDLFCSILHLIIFTIVQVLDHHLVGRER